MPAIEHSPADIIRYALIDLGLGTLPSDYGEWPIYVSNEPDQPDNCITIYDTQGILDGRLHLTGEQQEFYGFQARIRATDHVTGWVKTNAIAITLDENTYDNDITIDEIDYILHAVHRKTGVLPIGTESENSQRLLFTVNFTCTIVQA